MATQFGQGTAGLLDWPCEQQNVATMNVCRLAAVLAAILFTITIHAADPAPSPDLLVYGGTASGVMTAYSAAREGLRVVLLEPGIHLGGMVTGGLSATDLGHYTIIGGYARDFYMQAAAHYGVLDLNRPANWLSEPHVDEEIFRAMLKEAGVEVHFHQRVREQDGVELQGNHLASITTADGAHWRANVFADCSYEGDLMAQAKVSYAWGREAASEYGEDLAGVRDNTPKHQFLWPLSAYDEHHRLLPEIDPGPLAPPGSGDKKVQAYNFRLFLLTIPPTGFLFRVPRDMTGSALHCWNAT
jgi:glycine/D-amino acid oxidase-like deaminating enzyme